MYGLLIIQLTLMTGYGNNRTRKTLGTQQNLLTTTHAHSRDNITFFQSNIDFSTFRVLPHILFTCVFNSRELLCIFNLLRFHFITNFYPTKTGCRKLIVLIFCIRERLFIYLFIYLLKTYR